MQVRRRVFLTLAIGALVGTSCSVTNDGYTFVKNSRENLFFKLPDEWKQYPVTIATVTDRPVTATGELSRWAIEFDGAAKPNKKHLIERVAAAPVGFSEAFPLSSKGQDEISEKALRTMVLQELLVEPADPFDLVDQVPGRFEIVDYKQIRNKKGVWGHKIIVNIQMDSIDGETPQWLTVGQKIYLDRKAETLRRLVIRCSATCYRSKRSQLDTVLNSFSFRP